MENTTLVLYRLIDFAQKKELIEAEDRAYTMNRLMELFNMDAPEADDPGMTNDLPDTVTPILEEALDAAVKAGLTRDTTEQRDLFAGRIMGVFTAHPAEIRRKFSELYKESPEAATKYFYDLCRYVDYIKVDRIAKNVRYFHDTPVGELEITINLSKPEKDPRDIAAQRNARQTGYPRCMLCVENPGYAGRAGFPARQNHRFIPMRLNGEDWYMQYSPYAYYDEHCIVLNKQHVPMKISHDSFERLFDFVEQYPHYMLGSNADLPIVGGSILSHDHFQGGGYTFPMEHAKVRFELTSPDPSVQAYVSAWPMTCIVLKGRNRKAVVALADRMLDGWRGWTDAQSNIFAQTDDTPHNTITPVARMENGEYKLYLVLRNNLTTAEHPMGVYHPHEELHHIKKENIGLIEVMGLFILPGRLVTELNGIREYLTGKVPADRVPAEGSPLEKHYPWIRELTAKYPAPMTDSKADEIIRSELAMKCAQVLKDAGVYKLDDAGEQGLMRFLGSLGYEKN